MSDLTVEYYWVCRRYADYLRYQQPLPKKICTWNQYADGGDVVIKDGEKVCPRCGGEVISEGYGV